ncbi:MAG: hypothetical protein AAFX08_10765 [Pseudomonadota bacterium]
MEYNDFVLVMGPIVVLAAWVGLYLINRRGDAIEEADAAETRNTPPAE